MSKINTYACDICKVQKKEVNHWFIGFAYHGVSDSSNCISLYPWRDSVLNNDAKHLCGIECSMKWAAKELSKLVGNECVVTDTVSR